jgi:hypothetical protein
MTNHNLEPCNLGCWVDGGGATDEYLERALIGVLGVVVA